jgi:lysyl-tRNA synthetase class 2
VTSPPALPIFPSDLRSADDADTALGREPIALGGRVVRRAPDVLWIADAFVTLRIAGDLDVDPGDLVILSVVRRGGQLTATALLERHRPAGIAHGEQDRFIRDGVGHNLAIRARVIETVRAFFAARRFLEVDTPLCVPSPGLDLHLDAVETTSGYLITSPEYQMKRLLSAGVPRLFQIAHAFRRGEVGARHNPEFAILEWYRAFASVDDVIRDTEQLVTEVLRTIDGGGAGRTPNDFSAVAAPFERLPLKDAFARFGGVAEEDFFSMAEHDSDAFFRILVERVEPALASMNRPVFIVDYPISQASLARAKPADPRLCERFELYVGGVELCNGFGELTDPTEQRRRLAADQQARRAAGKAVYPIDERFIAALDEGMPPSAGNALGIDRLIALGLGELEIARVMPFPVAVL